ncbi:hypothetical protein SAMN05444388_10545 [Flavobacterium johnsoniae]|uniref:Uncharacterized protein n=2 Tax=Flavobacterium johnsoniae TaxID=986 RepID=A0A1M5NKU7_FLAJO|nr:hypothetical protein SAMN05444388_10545 [Flavobacterium johnsoniae]
MLEPHEWKIMKEISIVSKNSYDVEIVIGVVYYQREITPIYKLGEDPEPNNIIRLINYPRQELFPHDRSDELILNAIKNKYPKSTVRNYEIFFTADKEKFEHLMKRPAEKAIIEIRPDFSQVEYSSLVGKEFRLFRKDINIYREFTRESVQYQFFSTTCNFTKHEEIIDELEKIEFL